jgi:hypothetical protein
VERLPIIRRVIQTTDFITKAMGKPSRFAQGLRTDAGLVLPPVASIPAAPHFALIPKLRPTW